MIACYLWQRIGVAEWDLDNSKLTPGWTSRVTELLRAHSLDPRVTLSESMFVYWHFHSSGINESTRLKLQDELKNLLLPLAKQRAGTGERDVTIHWYGARTRIEEASAMNEHIQ